MILKILIKCKFLFSALEEGQHKTTDNKLLTDINSTYSKAVRQIESCTVNTETAAGDINTFIKDEIILSEDETFHNDIKEEVILLEKANEASSEDHVGARSSNDVHSQSQFFWENETPHCLNITHENEDSCNCSETDDILQEGNLKYTSSVRLGDTSHGAIAIPAAITQQKTTHDSLEENCGIPSTSGHDIQGTNVVKNIQCVQINILLF